ncbi:pentapeptide repeat-containing protein [Phaeobacter porticola]|nr:pentapeptide repeat-containing protein [Phaeobacter porticola]
MRSELSQEEHASALQPLLEAIPDKGEFKPVHLVNLSLLDDLQGCYETLPSMLVQLAPETGYTPEEALARFKDAIAVSVSKVVNQNSECYSPLASSLLGETAEPVVRSLAWERHAAWIRSQFHSEPIFSPDETETTPLSHVYLRLRARRNTRHSILDSDGKELGFYTTAEIGMLHDLAQEWLQQSTNEDPIRIVAGGPGCGKSSFARAFASEQLQDLNWRVLFVRLQHVRGKGPLRGRISQHLRNRYGWKHPTLCEGFPDSPFDWHSTSSKNLLLVFDGLDELSAIDEEATRLAQQFVNDTRHLLNDLNVAGRSARALILGRTTAVEQMRSHANLPMSAVLHVAPIRPLTHPEMDLQQKGALPEGVSSDNLLKDPDSLAKIDQRPVYWERWCRIKGIPTCAPPTSLTDARMKDLNAEPLLLHLLIVSEFATERWEEAADNRNVVYKDIFEKIFARNSKKGLDAYQGLNLEDFFDLMECFGLAAFRGNGRTGTNEDFAGLREWYAPEKFEKFEERTDTDLKSVALLTHTQHDIEGAGFEFVHKTFGEYLAARAILATARRASQRLAASRAPTEQLRVAEDWAKLFDLAEMTGPVIRFMKDEARLWPAEQALKVRRQMEHLMDWTLTNGMPVHHLNQGQLLNFNSLVERQRCAETTLLGSLTSLAISEPKTGEGKQHLVKLEALKKDVNAGGRMLHRITLDGPRNRLAGRLLSRLRLENVDLGAADLDGADLKEANLSGAVLAWARLSAADLRRADLSSADLSEAGLSAADLRGAKLSETELSGADLIGADLSGADLSRADLIGADLSKANLSKANLSKANLSGANLSKANLIGANLSGADLRGTKLSETELSRADLSGADLRRADLRRADLSGADLSGADLSEVDLSEAILKFTDLTGCTFTAMPVRSVDFTSSTGLNLDAVQSLFGVRSGVGKTYLPDSIPYPDDWHVGSDATEDTAGLVNEFYLAFKAWLSRDR